MEENNQQNENIEENKHICFKNHCWKMCLGMIAAAFFGGFLATYFVADQIMERCHKHYFMQPKFEQRMFRDFDREFRQDIKHFDKMMKKHKMPDFSRNEYSAPSMFMPEPVEITTEIDDGNFEVEVLLKPFQNDENKINYNISGKKLTVFGESKVKDAKSEQDISFSHDFILPEGADIANVKKVKDGDKVVISIPIKAQ